MCHFITLIAQTDAAASVHTVMQRHGRAAVPIDNFSIRRVLREGERQYLTTGGRCDCGSVFALRDYRSKLFEERLAKEEAHMKKKGWSDAKVARAMEGHRRADVKRRHRYTDSLDLWNAALHDLRGELKLPSTGLFIRYYSGDVATEVFSATRREVPKNVPWLGALASIEQDEVTIFR